MNNIFSPNYSCSTHWIIISASWRPFNKTFQDPASEPFTENLISLKDNILNESLRVLSKIFLQLRLGFLESSLIVNRLI